MLKAIINKINFNLLRSISHGTLVPLHFITYISVCFPVSIIPLFILIIFLYSLITNEVDNRLKKSFPKTAFLIPNIFPHTVIPIIPTTKPPAVCSQPVCVMPCAPACPQVCCKKSKIQKVVKRWARSNTEKPKKNCSCFIECGIQSNENKETCSERCKCNAVADVHSLTKVVKAVRKRSSSRSKQHILQIHKLFSKWFKKPTEMLSKGSSQRDAPNLNQKQLENKGYSLEKARYAFIEKMLKNYEYYRGRQEELKKIQNQHVSLIKQRKNLQNILDARKKQLGHKHRIQHKNKSSLMNGSKGKEFNEYVKRIEEQLAALKKKQRRLLTQKDFAESELRKEDDFFNKMNLVAQYDDGRVPEELMKAFTYDPIQKYQETKQKIEQYERQLRLEQQIQNQELQEEQLYLTPQEMQTMYATGQNTLDDRKISEYSDDTRDSGHGFEKEGYYDNQDLEQRYENMRNDLESLTNTDDDSYDDASFMYGPIFQ